MHSNNWQTEIPSILGLIFKLFCGQKSHYNHNVVIYFTTITTRNSFPRGAPGVTTQRDSTTKVSGVEHQDFYLEQYI